MDAVKCEAFLVAVESGSLTAAAEQMGYTQSGMTRMIGSLEEEVGFPLFVRSKKGVVLTENGKAMVPIFREIVHAHRNAEQMSADIRGTIKGYVKVGSYFSISSIIMPEIIKDFSNRYPGVSVRLEEGGNLEMARWLKEKSVDCCFCARPNVEETEWIPLIQDELVAWLPKDHPMAFCVDYPVKELEKEQFVYTSPNHDNDLDRFISEQKLNVNTRFSTRDAFTTYNLVEAGLGISLNQKMISRKWDGRVIERPFNPPQYIDLGIALPSLQDASPATMRFIECVREYCLKNEQKTK